MKQIKDFAMSRLTNAFHASFHHAIVSQIIETGEASLGLSTGFGNAYKQAVDTEQDIVNRTLGSAKTDALRAQDTLRDNYFRAVRNVLKNAKYSSVADITALYDTIYKKLLKPYPSSILAEGDHEESSHLRGFIVDVKQYLTSAEINKLGIAADLAALETANEAFETTYLERNDEYVQNPAGYGAQCREEVDKYWGKLVHTLNYYANETDNADGTVKMVAEETSTFVDNINKHIELFLRSVKASTPKGENDANGGSTGSQDSGNSGTSGNSGSSTEKPSGGNSGTSGTSGTSGGGGSTNTGGTSGTSGNSGTSGGYNNDL